MNTNDSLPYPSSGDDVGDHPAHDEGHYIESFWQDYGRDYESHVEYDHSKQRVRIVDDGDVVLTSDRSIKLADVR